NSSQRGEVVGPGPAQFAGIIDAVDAIVIAMRLPRPHVRSDPDRTEGRMVVKSIAIEIDVGAPGVVTILALVTVAVIVIGPRVGWKVSVMPGGAAVPEVAKGAVV